MSLSQDLRPPPAVTARTSQHADTTPSPLPRLDYVVVETVSRHGVSTSGSPSHMRRASHQRCELGAKAHVGSPSWPYCMVQRGEVLIVLCSPCLPVYHYLDNGLFNLCSSAFGDCEEEMLLWAPVGERQLLSFCLLLSLFMPLTQWAHELLWVAFEM